MKLIPKMKLTLSNCPLLMYMELRKRFEEIGVPCPDELPGDLHELVMDGLRQGRILCITRCKRPPEADETAEVTQAQWAFLKRKVEDD